MSLEDLKPCIRQLLVVLDFLHSIAHIIHTDIQLKNLLLPTPMPKALSDFEEREVKAQSARKVLQDRTIYTSARFPPGDGLPLLSDFGEARFGDQPHSEDIMPNPYRAPEVILKSSWSYKVDIWNVAMVAWDIVSTSTLIDGKNPDGVFDDRCHLAVLFALLGPPPPEFRQRSHLSSVFWETKVNGRD
ncbi:kinase-like domain-containing protein [Aspergillus sergii]|uniref:Kinase-like domain-containing protein n=1 Tax=Aspergillus sergii TaxID=1034303 RepID=A0A5N6XL71_9EURO|nr:kinase-like domain-containing protein [Aspergillus sergii]